MSDHHHERIAYQRKQSHRWNIDVITALVNDFLGDRRTSISREGASVDEVEIINNRMLLWIEGVETPLRYVREVSRWLGPEFLWSCKNRVFVDGSSENGVSLAARPCIEFNMAAAERTLRWRKAFQMIRLLLLVCCIFTFGIFLTKLMRLWEGYERPWTHFFPLSE